MRAHELRDERVKPPHELTRRIVIVPHGSGHDLRRDAFIRHVSKGKATPFYMTARRGRWLHNIPRMRSNLSAKKICNRRAFTTVIIRNHAL